MQWLVPDLRNNAVSLFLLVQLCDACLAPDTDNDGTGCDNMTCLLVFLQPT